MLIKFIAIMKRIFTLLEQIDPVGQRSTFIYEIDIYPSIRRNIAGNYNLYQHTCECLIYSNIFEISPIKVKVNVCSPVTGLEWPRGFQEVKVPRFHDNGTGWW